MQDVHNREIWESGRGVTKELLCDWSANLKLLGKIKSIKKSEGNYKRVAGDPDLHLGVCLGATRNHTDVQLFILGHDSPARRAGDHCLVNACYVQLIARYCSSTVLAKKWGIVSHSRRCTRTDVGRKGEGGWVEL